MLFWTIFLFVVGFTASVCGVNWLKRKFPLFNSYWTDGLVWGLLAVILIHMGIWWRWTSFWEVWQSQSGFVFFQIILAVGLYFKSLKDRKFLRHVSWLLIALSAIGIYWNITTADRINDSVEKVMSLGKKPEDLPPQDEKTEKTVTTFWKRHLPEENALSMLRIVRRQSGFNQFGKDGKPYRNPKNNYRLGVMQIDDALWLERAGELNDNIYELEGNLNFALWLYNQEGFAPWGYAEEEKISLLDKIKSWFKSSPPPPPSIQPAFSSPVALRHGPVCKEEDEEPRVGTRVRELLRDQPDLLERLKQESSCLHHHEMENGKFTSELLHGRDEHNQKGTAIGVAQINRGNAEWCLKEHHLDIQTVDGSIGCAKVLYALYGLQPWYTDNRSPNVLTFQVAVDNSTDFKVLLKKPIVQRAEWGDFNQDVEFRINGDYTFVDGVSHPYHELPKPVKTMEMRSVSGKPAIATFTYTGIRVGPVIGG